MSAGGSAPDPSGDLRGPTSKGGRGGEGKGRADPH